MPTATAWKAAEWMHVVAAGVQGEIRAGIRADMTEEAACLAALIGVLSVIRVDGLNEDALLRMARRAVPRDVLEGPM